MNNITKFALAVIFALISSTLGALIISIPIMLLWNYLMPGLFGFKEINFFQAVAMGMLSSLLFNTSLTIK